MIWQEALSRNGWGFSFFKEPALRPIPSLKHLFIRLLEGEGHTVLGFEDARPAFDEEFDAHGWLKITAYAKNGIAGEFEIKATEENGAVSILHGKFKLPLDMN